MPSDFSSVCETHSEEAPPPWTEKELARFEEFLDHLSSIGRRGRTLYAYRKDWEDFARWYDGANGEAFDLARMTAMDVADYMDSAIVQRRAPATINRRLVLIKRYVNFGVAKIVVRPDIAAAIQDIPRARTQTLAPKSLDKSQARRLLKEVELRATLRDKALITLLLYTGMRVGEVVRLERNDLTISPRKGSILIRSEIAKGGKQRVIPVPLPARTVMTDYLVSRRDHSPSLFVGQRGPIHEDAVARIVTKYAKHADLKISPHTLRHTFAFTFLEQNANDLIGLANILGHENIQTTRIYTQKRLQDLQQSSERIRYY